MVEAVGFLLGHMHICVQASSLEVLARIDGPVLLLVDRFDDSVSPECLGKILVVAQFNGLQESTLAQVVTDLVPMSMLALADFPQDRAVAHPWLLLTADLQEVHHLTVNTELIVTVTYGDIDVLTWSEFLVTDKDYTVFDLFATGLVRLTRTVDVDGLALVDSDVAWIDYAWVDVARTVGQTDNNRWTLFVHTISHVDNALVGIFTRRDNSSIDFETKFNIHRSVKIDSHS